MDNFSSANWQADHRGIRYQVLTNIQKVPDILVVGTVGAQDLLLFESSDSKISMYQSFFDTYPEIITSVISKQYIRVKRRWGGAAHYIAQELGAGSTAAAVGVWSVLGEDTRVVELIADLDKLAISYYLIVLEDVKQPRYPAVIFESGERYWSQRYIVLEAAKQLSSWTISSHLLDSHLVVLATQPIPSLLKFLRAVKTQAAIQLFEDYLPELFTDSSLKDNLWEQLRHKCVLLNLNEVELWLIARLYYDLKEEDLTTVPLIRAELMDQIIGRLTMDLRNTLIVVGLGSLGALISCRTAQDFYQFGIPSLSMEGIFGVGAGDIAWASAIRTVVRLITDLGHSIAQLQDTYATWGKDSFLDILRAFVIGGLKGCTSPDIFEMTISDHLAFRSAMTSWLSMLTQLPVLTSVYELVLYQQSTRSYGFNWANHSNAVAHQEKPDYEKLLLDAFSADLGD